MATEQGFFLSGKCFYLQFQTFTSFVYRKTLPWNLSDLVFTFGTCLDAKEITVLTEPG